MISIAGKDREQRDQEGLFVNRGGMTQAPLNGGFTLLELLIVLLLLALGSIIVLPSFEQGLKRVEARRSALELGAVARYLRSKAIYEGRSKGLIIDPLENSYQAMNQRRVIFPSNVKITRIEGGEPAGDGRRIFIFFPNGSILGGEIGISGSEGTSPYYIRFNSLSGRIGIVRGI